MTNDMNHILHQGHGVPHEHHMHCECECEENHLWCHPSDCDGHHHDHHHNHHGHHHHHDDEIQHETSKTVDLHDQFDTVHFKVRFFTTTVTGVDFRLIDKYTVQVLSLVGPDIRNRKYQVVFEQSYEIRHEAMKVFQDKVNLYDSYVRANNRDIQDVNLYKDAIGYHRIDPDCCFNCRFCRGSDDQHHLVCTNSDNFVFFQNALDHTSRCHVDITPRVEICGLCKNYQRRDHGQCHLTPPIPKGVEIQIHRDMDRKIGQAIEEFERGIVIGNSGDSEHII